MQRTAKFVKYLPESGWNPVVLTVAREMQPRDESLLAEIPAATTVRRTGEWDPILWARAIAGRLKRQGSEKRDPDIAAAGLGVALGDRSIKQWLRSLFFIPEREIVWLAPAVAAGLKLIRERRISAIYASGPPFTGHIVGTVLSQLAGLPLVVDFRDEWATDPYVVHPTPLHRWAIQFLERHTIRRCRALLTVSEPLAEQFRTIYPSERDKVFVLTNGYDPADFAGLRRAGSGLQTVVYTGNIGGSRDPRPLFSAFRELLDEGHPAVQSTIIKIAGTYSADVKEAIDDTALTEHVHLMGYLSHRASLQLMLDATVQWLIVQPVANSEGYVTGKVFEYLAAQRPILGMAPRGGALDELLHETGAGQVVVNDDVPGIKAALVELLGRSGNGPLYNAERFSRRAHALWLGQLLDQVGGNGR